MPTYTVKDPSSGKTITLKGDSPPSEQELNDIFSKIGGQPDWKGVIKSAVSSAFMKPGTVPNKLMVPSLANAPAQAKALPPLASLAGGISPIPGGSTMFGEGARALSDAALAFYGMKDQIPSGMAHLGELAANIGADVIATPAIKKKYYGSQIGKIEKARGVPPPQDIPSIPMATGQKTTGEFINDAVQSVKASEGRGSATYWKQIKDQVDRLYRMGKDEALTDLDKGRLKWLNQQAQKGLNEAVSGRAGPAGALARSQTIPNAIGRGIKMLPPKTRAGLAWGTGALGPAVAIEEIVRRLIQR